MGRGMADYMEPLFHKVAPGGLRKLPPSTAEVALPGQIPVGAPADVPFRWVKEVVFDTWEAYGIVVGAAPLRLDAANILRRDRRAVMIVNSHVANGLWIGHSASVTTASGLFIPAGGGAVSLPLSEKAQIWAVATAGGTIACLIQFA